jgi:putative endonuclease
MQGPEFFMLARRKFAGRLTQAALLALDWLAAKTLSPEDTPAHLRIGRRGEEDAYFNLRRNGYTMIARNFRSSQHGGELDIVRWDQDVLCFIEVKTRTKPVLKPAEAVVDRDKRSYCRLPTTSCARYLRRASGDST